MFEFPSISIITAVHNGAPYLRDLIESVWGQGYPHLQHIVIDDGSNDDGATRRILEEYPQVTWWSRENKGQYATQNEALAAATGEIVGVISSDDVYEPNTLWQIAARWKTNPTCDLAYGKTLYMDANGDLLPYQLDLTSAYPRTLLKYYLYIQHSSLFVRRDLILDQGIWFDPSYRYAGDWDWILRLAQSCTNILYIPEPLSIIRVHANQVSRTAGLDRVAAEHKRVCATYGASYRVHDLLRSAVKYRAFMMIGIAVCRTKGLRACLAKVRTWRHRRYAKL